MSDASKARYGQQVSRQEEMAYLPVQESASVKGSVIAADPEYVADGVYVVKDPKHNKPTTAKGVRLRSGSAGGDIEVHLADNPADHWDVYDGLLAGEKYGMAFDKIRSTNTTLVLDDDVLVLV